MKRTFENFLQMFVKQTALIFVRLYQLILSPFLGGACRFEPTCSHYAVDVLKQQDPLTAVILISKRLSKCHPWGGYGYDPAPKAPSTTNSNRERSLLL